jgi:hypothetical protein
VFTAILLLIMSPAGTSLRVQSSQANAAPAINIPDFGEESPADLAAYEERDFILRLNGLSKALSAFIDNYKNGQVDLKKVKSLQKAMHDLEKSEWFRPSKAK